MQQFGSRFCHLSLVLLLAVSLSGCRDYTLRDFGKSAEEQSYFDRDLKLSSDDYNKALAPKPVPDKAGRGNAPSLMPVVADEQRGSVLPQPLVSVTVNQDVPLRDVFYELAKQAQIDIEMDPDITGSTIFTAYNRPFDQVVSRLSELAGLRYKYEDGVLRVERDLPYIKTYRVDYSGLTRSFDSEIKANTGVDSSSIGASGGSGGQNGSKSTIATKTNSDFWKELETNMTQILQIGRYQQEQDNKSAAPLTTPSAIPAVTTQQLAATGAAAAPAQPAAIAPQPPAVAEEKKEELKGTGGAGDPYYSINRQAGLISVFASDAQHKKVAEYLHQLRLSMNTQIMIEAKVLEVQLSDEYVLGIDWDNLIRGDFTLNANLSNPNFIDNKVSLGSGVSGNIFNIGFSSEDVGRIFINALSRYGTIRSLSSPRITVMNNQSALLNVSENQVFFDLDITVQPSTGFGVPGLTTINSQIKAVPVGLIINVQPTVDMDTNEITMNIRPSVTKIVGQVNDPAIAFLADAPAGAVNAIPVLAVRELDSVIQSKSGETIVMGGLMQDSTKSTQVGVPVLSKIPLVGNLFKSQQDETSKTELVIMLKASVMKPKPDATDREMYKKLGADRHPISVD